ncbi:MAG: four helix bundle protein [Bacteroidales bacterium]|nr:MAG: four helix bundle protein [Bacteroidales bacterium]
MPLATRFEDLEIWKIAREIVNNIHNDFSEIKDYSFKNQIYSEGFSIMNNISEGFGRESKQEFHRFLDFAKGSCCEVKNMYYIAEDLKYLDAETSHKRREKCELEKNSIAKFMKYLKIKPVATSQQHSNTVTQQHKQVKNE